MEIKSCNPIFITKNIIIFCWLSFVILSANQLRAETFNIQSIDGKAQVINILLNGEHEILTIATIKDTLRLKNCIDIENASVWNKYFIKIIYRLHAGSGLNVLQMMILTSKSDKIYESLHITSLFKDEFIDYSKEHVSTTQPDMISSYQVKINLLNSNPSNLKLKVHTKTWEKIRDNPKKNSNKSYDNILNFDTRKNIFYGGKVKIAKSFTVYNPKTNQKKKQFIEARSYLINLGGYNYYYLDDYWYSLGGINDLSKFTYK